MSGERVGRTRPPGPPRHMHDDGATCMWVRHNSIDRWRLVDEHGNDLGPCPGFAPVSGEADGRLTAELTAFLKARYAVYRPDAETVARAIVEEFLPARVDANAAAAARVRAIPDHAITAAIYSGGGAVHPDATSRVQQVITRALRPDPSERGGE